MSLKHESRVFSRIVIDARKLGDGGIGVYTQNLITALYESNLFKIAILASDKVIKEKTKTIEAWQGIEVVVDNSKKYSFSESFILPIKHRKKLENSILHFPHYTVPFFLPKSSKVTCTIHDCIHLNSSSFLKRIASYFFISHALKRSELICTVSNYSKKQIYNNFCKNVNFKNKKIENVSNYIEPSLEGLSLENVSNINKNSETNYYLCISSDLKHKGLDLLIKAWQEITDPETKEQGIKEQDTSASELIVLGSKNKAKIKGLTFIEKCSDEELKKLYKNAKALIIPSLEEGFGIPALEALGLGLPVVAFSLPSLVENFANSIWYADRFSYKSLADTIVLMSKESEKREEKIQLGMKISKNFSKSYFSNKITEVFKSISNIKEYRVA